MLDDGDIDYKSRSLDQLRESCWNIDRKHYPKNLRNLLQELAARGETDPTIAPTPDKTPQTQDQLGDFLKFAKSACFTTSICAALLVIFALEFICRGPSSGIQNSIVAAGLVKDAAIQGEWWRLLTGPLLHANVQHCFYNIIALFLFGGVVESLASRLILPLLVLSSALGGSLMSLLFLPHATTVGISGAVMGVMGFFLAYQLTRSPRLPLAAFSWVGINIGINLSFGVLAHGTTIDNAAHIGGLLTGLALGLILTARHRTGNEMPIRESRTVRVLGFICATLLGVSCCTTAFLLITAGGTA